MQDKQKVIEMMKYLKGSGFVELSKNANSITTFADARGAEQIYFCAGMDERPLKRCSNNSFTKKNYVYIDIDIRNDHFKNTSIVLSDEAIEDEIIKIIKVLDENGYDYQILIHSGNGLHLYFLGDETEFTPEEYSNGVSMLAECIDLILLPLGYKCDDMCKNISRLSRMPGSINTRKKQSKDINYDMGKKEVEILEMDLQGRSLWFDLLKQGGIARKSRQDKLKQIKKEYRAETTTGDIREQINKIPANEIAEVVRGVETKDNGKDDVMLWEGHKSMGAYWYRPYNIIVNTGSSRIKTDKRTFTPFEIVLFEVCGGDKKATLEYFKQKYGIEEIKETKNVKKPQFPLKQKYDKQGFVYPSSIFAPFECLTSAELCTIVAPTNVGKTTFAVNILKENKKLGKKPFYINLEFPLEVVAEGYWLMRNNKTKINLTELAPLNKEEKKDLEIYKAQFLKQFDYYENPQGETLENIIDIIVQKQKEGYSLFCIDTFSKIEGNLSGKEQVANQNKCIQAFQTLCQNIGICLILLHHTNKNGVFEGSQKIKDLSNVFIELEPDTTMQGQKFTRFILSKDKLVSYTEIEVVMNKGEYFIV